MLWDTQLSLDPIKTHKTRPNFDSLSHRRDANKDNTNTCHASPPEIGKSLMLGHYVASRGRRRILCSRLGEF